MLELLSNWVFDYKMIHPWWYEEFCETERNFENVFYKLWAFLKEEQDSIWSRILKCRPRCLPYTDHFSIVLENLP